MQRFEIEPATAYINGTYYFKNKRRQIPVTVKSHRHRAIKCMCFGLAKA